MDDQYFGAPVRRPAPPSAPEPVTWYAPAAARSPKDRLVAAGVAALAVVVLGAVSVPAFTAQKAKGEAAAAKADARAVLAAGRMPLCEPAEGVTVSDPLMTCAPNRDSDALRAAVQDQCGRTEATLTREWWRPTSDTVAFFHTYADDRDDRITMPAGAVDCG